MQEMGNPPEPGYMVDLGFVVDWQLTEDVPAVIDLSRVDAEVLLLDEATIEASSGRPG